MEPKNMKHLFGIIRLYWLILCITYMVARPWSYHPALGLASGLVVAVMCYLVLRMVMAGMKKAFMDMKNK